MGDLRRREAADPGEVEDWLPEGWTVQVRARRNGRKDKYYLSPSNQYKFNSKSKVSRYLNTLQTSSSCPGETKNVTTKLSRENVVIEKTTADGLPPGWIKEIKVTKKGGKMRRDRFYTDPATGYIFRSMKDALRYVETGDLGRLAFKPKDKGNDDVELEDDNVSSATVAKKQRIADTKDYSEELCSKLEVTKSDELLLKASTCTEEYPPLSGHTYDECVVDADLSCTDLPKNKDPEKEQMESGAVQSDNSSKKHHGHKPKDKRISNIPRRTSKRLAGAEVNPALEIKPNARVSVKESYEAEANEVKIDQPKSGLETESTSVTLTSKAKEAVRGDVKSQSSLDLPLDILNDPCIEFAIKTLTGAAFDTSEVLAESNNSKKCGSSLDLGCGDFWTDPCIEFAVKTLTGAIPLEYGVDLTQQANSSQTRSVNTLSNVDIYQAEFWCPKFTKQQTLVEPSAGTKHSATGARSK